MTLAAQTLRLARLRANRERHHIAFRTLWRAIGGPEIGEEVTFTNRRWRLDFAHNVAKVAVEIQGGIWRPKGAHNTGAAIQRDCAKALEAALLGWVVIPLTPDMVTVPNLQRIAALVRERAVQMADAYKEAA